MHAAKQKLAELRAEQLSAEKPALTIQNSVTPASSHTLSGASLPSQNLVNTSNSPEGGSLVHLEQKPSSYSARRLWRSMFKKKGKPKVAPEELLSLEGTFI